MGQNEVDEFVAGMVGFGGQLVQLGENVLPNADGDDPIAVLALPLDDQRILLHVCHPPFRINYRLT